MVGFEKEKQFSQLNWQGKGSSTRGHEANKFQLQKLPLRCHMEG